MPAVDLSTEDSSAFTVINHEERRRRDEHDVTLVERVLPRNVNVVKPLQRAAEPAPDAPGMGAPQGPHTILDPKFSRALDFKLRRLKEKEILQANLRRPTKFRPTKNGLLAASNPNISSKEQVSPGKLVSRSNPRIDIIPPENDKKISPKMDKSPSPGRKSRTRKISGSNDGEKPRFITTVKTGQFLLPPPEVASLLGLQTLYPPQEREKIVYSYASKPKAVPMRSKRSIPDKKEGIPNGGTNISTVGADAGNRRPHAGDVFGGVRALVAGVVGMRHLLEQTDKYEYVASVHWSSCFLVTSVHVHARSRSISNRYNNTRMQYQWHYRYVAVELIGIIY